MLVPPHAGGLAEQRHVEDIGFVGIDERLGSGRYVFRNQVLLDGVGMNPVIDLGQLPVEVPAEGEAAVFFALELW